jgi:hypothetical protein
MSRFEDTGLRVEKLAFGASFPCECGNGKIANGIVQIGVLKEYQFACTGCNRIHRMSPAGRLYRVAV